MLSADGRGVGRRCGQCWQRGIKDDAVSIQVLKMKVKGEGCRPSVQVEKNGFHFKASSKCISFFLQVCLTTLKVKILNIVVCLFVRVIDYFIQI